MRFCLLIFILIPSFVLAIDRAIEPLENDEGPEGKDRQKKVFSLFSIVTFKNVGCTSNQSSRNGTCFTTTECANKGGTSAGNCAAGFGVCCLFIVSAAGSTISQNCSYIQNPSFPSVYGATTALTYTINKCSTDVCSFRLDFNTFTVLGPLSTLEASPAAGVTGHDCQDKLIVSSTASGLASPTLCGQGTGQHLYIEVGQTAAATATVAFTFAAAASTVRTWDIKVTQIPCFSPSRPPAGCLQYHTGLTGAFKTFNFINSATPQHLASQRYSICIRPEAGYCCVQYNRCADAFSFSLDLADAAAMAMLDTSCTKDYLAIDGFSEVCSPNYNGAEVHSKLCGLLFSATNLNTVGRNVLCDCTAPFTVQVVTDNLVDTIAPTAASPSRGVCLEYSQVPC